MCLKLGVYEAHGPGVLAMPNAKGSNGAFSSRRGRVRNFEAENRELRASVEASPSASAAVPPAGPLLLIAGDE